MIKEKKLMQEVLNRCYKVKLTSKEVPVFIRDELRDCYWLMLDGTKIYKLGSNTIVFDKERVSIVNMADAAGTGMIVADIINQDMWDWDEIRPAIEMVHEDADYMSFMDKAGVETRVSLKLLQYIKRDKWTDGKYYQRNINEPVYYLEDGHLMAILFPMKFERKKKQ